MITFLKRYTKNRSTMKVLIYFSKISPNYYLTIIFRPQLNYGDIIYERANNSSFHLKWKLIHYIYTLAITVTGKNLLNKKLPRIGSWITSAKAVVKETLLLFLRYATKNQLLNSSISCYLLIKRVRQEIYFIFLMQGQASFFFWASAILEWNK